NAEPTQTTVSADRTPIAEVESAPLAMVMAFMLRHSDNTLAEEFGRLLALSTKQENSPAGATAAVRNELRTLGIDLTGLQMADCS
ncbi:D-alanyl-D-alanine carboxypeptidase, partial [Erysipelatoclostridium ramosum]|nr:D-alanyl-D-alanine carboxypeptidase [Thomasclavelia ramosa]